MRSLSAKQLPLRLQWHCTVIAGCAAAATAAASEDARPAGHARPSTDTTNHCCGECMSHVTLTFVQPPVVNRSATGGGPWQLPTNLNCQPEALSSEIQYSSRDDTWERLRPTKCDHAVFHHVVVICVACLRLMCGSLASHCPLEAGEGDGEDPVHHRPPWVDPASCGRHTVPPSQYRSCMGPWVPPPIGVQPTASRRPGAHSRRGGVGARRRE